MAKRNQPKAYKHHRLEWPNNLLDAIFGNGFHASNIVTEDQLAAIDYVIATGLDTRQQEVIHHRYTKGMSLVDIANIYGLSRERIRQIETAALHLLKNPVRANVIKMGLNAFYEQDIKKLYYARQNMLTTKLVEFLQWLYEFEYDKLGLPAPDLVIYLDVPTEFTEAMMRKREADTNTKADIHEQDMNYLATCRNTGRKAANYYNWTVIDCVRDGKMRSIEDIHAEIRNHVNNCLKE